MENLEIVKDQLNKALELFEEPNLDDYRDLMYDYIFEVNRLLFEKTVTSKEIIEQAKQRFKELKHKKYDEPSFFAGFLEAKALSMTKSFEVKKLKDFCNHLNTYKGFETVRFDFMLVDFIDGSKIKTSAELIFCEKCIGCKYLNKNTGECININKLNWVDKDCKDYCGVDG